MAQYDVKLLNALLDSYENSLLFRGENKIAVRISFAFTKKSMPEYFDESSLAYDDIHSAVRELEARDYLTIVWKEGKENHIIQKLVLNEKNLDAVYAYVKRKPRSKKEEEILTLLRGWENRKTPVTAAFVAWLEQRIAAGKSVKEFLDVSDREAAKRLLTAVSCVEENKETCYIREFSIRHFGDTKTLESLLGVLGKVMRQFVPEYAGMDIYGILAEYSIYHTPDYVYLKGNAELMLEDESGSRISLYAFRQGLGFTGEDVGRLKICAGSIKRVVTIENLTTFFRWEEKDSLIIYLGGYHNAVRRRMIQMIYAQNPDAQYFHFGDIDVGGFEIYRDLCEKTKVPFQLYHMGIAELRRYHEYTKKLTENDRKRLRRLMEREKIRKEEGGNADDILEVLEYMDKCGRKLEQEIVEAG